MPFTSVFVCVESRPDVMVGIVFYRVTSSGNCSLPGNIRWELFSTRLRPVGIVFYQVTSNGNCFLPGSVQGELFSTGQRSVGIVLYRVTSSWNRTA